MCKLYIGYIKEWLIYKDNLGCFLCVFLVQKMGIKNKACV